MVVGCVNVPLKARHIIDFIGEPFKVDIVGFGGKIIFRVRQGERYGGEYAEAVEKSVRYVLPVDHKTIEIGVWE